jgi:ornithine carbamoyltransferase
MKIDRLNTIEDLSGSDILGLLDIAEALENRFQTHGEFPPALRGKCLASVFDETSLRTRNAFERGMGDLGGQTISFSSGEVRVGSKAEKPEYLKDFINVIGRFNDILLTRIYDHRIQTRLSEMSPIPFINGMCDLHHPTQALCDALTIRRRLGRIEGVKIAFVGDGTNVALSLAQFASRVGATFMIATPPGWGLPREMVSGLDGFHATHDANEAASEADVIVGDVWIPMNMAHEADTRRRTLEPYRITSELMDRARDHAFFMHNLPANRGDEVTAEVIDGPRSAVYEEAVARLHIARALLLTMLHPDPQAYVDTL